MYILGIVNEMPIVRKLSNDFSTKHALSLGDLKFMNVAYECFE